MKTDSHVLNFRCAMNKTPLEPAKFHFKTYNLSILTKSLQLHNSPVNCARELFKPSKD